MNLESVLFTQGFGSRRQCRALIADGRVTIDGTVCADPDADVPTEALNFTVDGAAWPYREHAYLLLNKPAGYECSREPQHHLSVFSLLPPQFAARGVQCVGRLDQDTTGLLLLSDDGKFVHAFTSPKRKVPKVYVATTRHPLDDAQLGALREGVLAARRAETDRRRRSACARRARARTHRARRQIPPGQADGRGGGQPRGGAASRADRRTRACPRRSPKAHGNGSTKPTSDLYGAGKPVERAVKPRRVGRMLCAPPAHRPHDAAPFALRRSMPFLTTRPILD